MIDFTDCEIDPYRCYDGANGSKRCVIYKGKHYMLKFSPKAKTNKQMSYSNSVYSEYLGSSILASLGLPVQKTLLGVYNIGDSSKEVVACEDFCQNDFQLISFAALKNTIIDSEHNGYGTELEDILNTIQTQTLIDPNILLDYFWEMFIADALIGNFDRHNGNWGLLVNSKKSEVKLAPIFDNGSCLYPQADETIIRKILLNKEELLNRIYVFPNSAIKMDNTKLNYYDFLKNTTNRGCLKALTKVASRINLDAINLVIEKMPISELQKKFYKVMIQNRKELIIDECVKGHNSTTMPLF